MGQQSFCRFRFKQLVIAAVWSSAYLATTAGLISCQGTPLNLYQQTTRVAGISICEIVTHKESYIGKTVEISALWKTDNLNYSYFEDIKVEQPKCHDGTLVQLGYISKMNDISVGNFFDVGKELCKARNQLISCTQAAYVRFVATIMSDKDGLYVHLNKVLNYRYLE